MRVSRVSAQGRTSGLHHLEFSREGGGACRDRTDDLKLAKLALSQLSYGPEPNGHEGAH